MKRASIGLGILVIVMDAGQDVVEQFQFRMRRDTCQAERLSHRRR